LVRAAVYDRRIFRTALQLSSERLSSLRRQAEVLPLWKEGTNFDKLFRPAKIANWKFCYIASDFGRISFTMTDKLLVLTTAGSQAEARKLAQALVERRQAACVNIVPGVEYIYRWRGKAEQAQEWMLLIKTTEAAFELVRDTIKELHSYELAECIAISISDGSLAYLQWIADSVG
jgi:periplasmic divalent cation tolerance protein